jgi:hypothetical protein
LRTRFAEVYAVFLFLDFKVSKVVSDARAQNRAGIAPFANVETKSDSTLQVDLAVIFVAVHFISQYQSIKL